MLRDLGHLHPVGFGEDSQSALVDTTHPCIEPMPQLADEDAREAARNVLRWVLEAVGPKGIVTKILALRFVLPLEPDSMECVAKKHGLREPRSVNIAPCSLIHSECRALGRTQLAKHIRTRQVWKSGRPKK
jgi:hypothetical protein